MENFKTLLNAIADTLKKYGFTKQGDTFYLLRSNNWGVLNFQKSKSSSAKTILFTMNIGISSTVLRGTVNHSDVNVKPKIEECHWQARIGSLMPQKPDYWWKIDSTVPIEKVIDDVIATIKALVLPAIESHISDEDLEWEWINGTYAGTTQLLKYIYLTTLLKVYNKSKLPEVIAELKKVSKGKASAYIASEHIKYLENLVVQQKS